MLITNTGMTAFHDHKIIVFTYCTNNNTLRVVRAPQRLHTVIFRNTRIHNIRNFYTKTMLKQPRMPDFNCRRKTTLRIQFKQSNRTQTFNVGINYILTPRIESISTIRHPTTEREFNINSSLKPLTSFTHYLKTSFTI